MAPGPTQRHGRPDSAQQYAKSIPEATLTITVDGSRHVVRQKDFASLPRASRSVPSRKAGSVRTFAGVLLTDLVPADPVFRHYDIHHGFFHTRRLDDSMVSSTAILIADAVDGRPIDRASLFSLIATGRDGNPIVIGKVTGIDLQRSLSEPR